MACWQSIRTQKQIWNQYNAKNSQRNLARQAPQLTERVVAEACVCTHTHTCTIINANNSPFYKSRKEVEVQIRRLYVIDDKHIALWYLHKTTHLHAYWASKIHQQIALKQTVVYHRNQISYTVCTYVCAALLYLFIYNITADFAIVTLTAHESNSRA